MPEIIPYRIAVSQERLDRLKQKLALTDFPEELDDCEPWTHGPPLGDIKRLVNYWRDGFDWRQEESKLNEMPQFMTAIQVDGFGSYDVHFIHQKSKIANAIPLLFLHGWPGSIIEVTKIIGLLIEGGNDYPAFHVVAPSLIDFGFSSASKKKDFNIDQHAEACHKLMQTLGYKEYVIEGGDVGSMVARFMALNYGKAHVKAHHLSQVAPAEPNETDHPELHAKVQATPLSEGEVAGLGRSALFSSEGNGYFRQLATRPVTAGYFMTDSPVGLLAWIYEKLHDWAHDYPWTDDEILTWISIYYFSKPGPAATAFIYYAFDHRQPLPVFPAAQAYSDVPLGISRFPQDLILLPKLWNHTMGPIVFEREHPTGGHFAAWECPEAIVGDLREMFGPAGGAFGVTKNNGFVEADAEAEIDGKKRTYDAID